MRIVEISWRFAYRIDRPSLVCEQWQQGLCYMGEAHFIIGSFKFQPAYKSNGMNRELENC